jgi:hypothetical protein
MIHDERLAEALRTFYVPEPVVRPDRLRMSRRVLDEVHEMPQDRSARRRLPWSRQAHYPAAIPDTGYVPAPIPATNGHTPTVTGRTQTMFSPAKAITAAALVFGIGGVLLIAQPIGRQDSAPGAAQGEDVAVSPPVEFTGKIVCGPEVQAGTREVVSEPGEVPGHTKERDHAWQPVVTEMSEPRMEGDYYLSWNADNFAGGVLVGSGTWRIENEEGAWQGSFVKADYPDHQTTVSSALAGEGAYAGLTAIWESILNPDCTWDVRGVIIEGEPPAVPEPYIAE